MGLVVQMEADKLLAVQQACRAPMAAGLSTPEHAACCMVCDLLQAGPAPCKVCCCPADQYRHVFCQKYRTSSFQRVIMTPCPWEQAGSPQVSRGDTPHRQHVVEPFPPTLGSHPSPDTGHGYAPWCSLLLSPRKVQTYRSS